MFRIETQFNDGDIEFEKAYHVYQARDVYDAIYNVTNEVAESERASMIVYSMLPGDKFKSGRFKYEIKCYDRKR